MMDAEQTEEKVGSNASLANRRGIEIEINILIWLSHINCIFSWKKQVVKARRFQVRY